MRRNSIKLLAPALSAGLLAGCGTTSKPRASPTSTTSRSLATASYAGDRLSKSFATRLQSLLPHGSFVVHVMCTQSESRATYFCYVLTNHRSYAYVTIVKSASRYDAVPSASDLARPAPPPKFSGSL